MRVDRLYASNGGVTQTIFTPLILLLSFCYSQIFYFRLYIFEGPYYTTYIRELNIFMVIKIPFGSYGSMLCTNSWDSQTVIPYLSLGEDIFANETIYLLLWRQNLRLAENYFTKRT